MHTSRKFTLSKGFILGARNSGGQTALQQRAHSLGSIYLHKFTTTVHNKIYHIKSPNYNVYSILKIINNSYTKNKEIKPRRMFGNRRKKLHKLGRIPPRFSREIRDSLRSTYFQHSLMIHESITK